MTSCIVGKKIGAVGSGHLELFPFVVLAICVLSLMAMAWGISEHLLTSWSSLVWFLGRNADRLQSLSSTLFVCVVL